MLTVVDGIAHPFRPVQLFKNSIQICDGVGLVWNPLLRQVCGPLLLRHGGQHGFAQAGTVHGGGLPQNIPVWEHPDPVQRVGHIEIEHAFAIWETEIYDLICLPGSLHHNVVHCIGIAQILVDHKGKLQHLQPQGVPAIRRPGQIPHVTEGGHDIVDIGFGDSKILRQLTDSPSRVLRCEAGQKIQRLSQRFDLDSLFFVHSHSPNRTLKRRKRNKIPLASQ